MNLQPLLDSINYRGIVAGLTHDFYRYPARFSPLFARAAIELFTKPGETVLDPFAGGCTSLVEALAAGRSAVGTDISELAVFLGRAKTTLLTAEELDEVVDWAIDTAPLLSPRAQAKPHIRWRESGYQTNLPWRFRKIAEQGLNRTARLPERLQPSARCILLHTLQWAVDCKNHHPTATEFREEFINVAGSVTEGLKALAEQARLNRPKGRPTAVEVFKASAAEITGVPSTLLKRSPPSLVVTSPPYPAVHVLYHRWQVHGRQETPAPFWIADCVDGQGAAHYTFGDRRRQDHDDQYFARLQRCFTEVRKVVRDGCIVAQLVGFARPDEQLPLYMDAMKKAGFEEYDLAESGHRPRDFWRAVPNRKWYVWLRENTRQTREVLLLHRATSS